MRMDNDGCPSTIAWIKDVPDTWPILPAKRLFAIYSGGTPRSTENSFWDGDIPWVTPADLSDLPSLFVGKSQRMITQDGFNSCNVTEIPEGSIILATRAPIGPLAINTVRLCTNQGCKALVPKTSVVAKYYAYLLGSCTAELNINGNGTTFTELSLDALANFRVPHPTEETQLAVVAFLDRETTEIDTLIAEQQRAIELLAEKRQAVISYLVTKGINPKVRMKESGTKFLGTIPAHWDAKRLKFVSPEVTVGIVVEPSKYYTDKGVPALRSFNISPGSISLQDVVFISDEANELHAKSKLHSGDLVAVRSGQPGTTAVVPPELEGCNCIDLIIIRRPSIGCERFLCWFLASDVALQQFAAGSDGAIQKHFNIETAMNLVVTVPPSDEQVQIAKYIQEETSELDSMVTEAKHAIELLQERRSALISAAVTGKIDVRGYGRTAA